VLLVPAALALAAACAASAPPPQAATPTRSSSNISAKLLTGEACNSLAQWILDACNARGNDRAARTEGWCSDVEQHTSSDDRGWVHDCTQHITEMDEACFRSTTSVPSLMDCDAAVSR
jgi:hypothetical protein